MSKWLWVEFHCPGYLEVPEESDPLSPMSDTLLLSLPSPREIGEGYGDTRRSGPGYSSIMSHHQRFSWVCCMLPVLLDMFKIAGKDPVWAPQGPETQQCHEHLWQAVLAFFPNSAIQARNCSSSGWGTVFTLLATTPATLAFCPQKFSGRTCFLVSTDMWPGMSRLYRGNELCR